MTLKSLVEEIFEEETEAKKNGEELPKVFVLDMLRDMVERGVKEDRLSLYTRVKHTTGEERLEASLDILKDTFNERKREHLED